jgi:hypothetical protein
MLTDNTNECRCGSGLEKYGLFDARGIFCCYVCEACERDQKRRYRPEIFTDPNYWALEDIG